MDVPIPMWMLWAAVGVAAALAGAAVVLVVAGRRSRRPTAPADLDYHPPAGGRFVPPAGSARTAKPAAFMPPPAPLAAGPHDPGADQRATYRRVGNAVLVLLSDAADPQRPFQAWVVDRSRQGLKLAAEKPAARGGVYTVRPVNAPPAAPWTAIEVRHCAAQDGYWEVGCRFLQPPSMQVLVLFG